MMDIDIKGDGRYASSRRAAYKYSIDSWKKWCDKNDCELFVLNDLILENDHEIGFHTMKHDRIDSSISKEEFGEEVKKFAKLTNGKSKGDLWKAS